MKTLVLIIGITMSILSGVNAQEKQELPPAKDRADMQTEMMVEKLNLTEDQKGKVMEVNLNTALKMDDVFKQTDKMAKFKGLRTVSAEKDKALKGILSKEQFKIYQDMKSEMQKMIKQKRKENK